MKYINKLKKQEEPIQSKKDLNRQFLYWLNYFLKKKRKLKKVDLLFNLYNLSLFIFKMKNEEKNINNLNENIYTNTCHFNIFASHIHNCFSLQFLDTWVDMDLIFRGIKNLSIFIFDKRDCFETPLDNIKDFFNFEFPSSFFSFLKKEEDELFLILKFDFIVLLKFFKS